MASMFGRMVGAAKLNAATYEEVEADRGATGQAVLIAVLSSLAITIGDYHPGDTMLAFKLALTLVGWLSWLFIVWLIGVKLVPEAETRSDLGELVRTTGFGFTPGLFRVLGVLPMIGWLLVILAWLWTLATSVVAVRQALDYRSLKRAIFVCVIAFATQILIIRLLVGAILSVTT